MRPRGFTLVEMAVVVAVVGTLAVFVAPVLVRALSAYDAMDESVATFAKMRYAMERIARELREVRRDPLDATSYHFTSMTPNNATFYKDDGTEVAISSSGSTVSIDYVGTASGTLTDQVAAFAFAYFQQDGLTAAAGGADVGFVQVSMTLTDGSTSYQNRLRVDLRNMP